MANKIVKVNEIVTNSLKIHFKCLCLRWPCGEVDCAMFMFIEGEENEDFVWLQP
jgi:hypothetical protein